MRGREQGEDERRCLEGGGREEQGYNPDGREDIYILGREGEGVFIGGWRQKGGAVLEGHYIEQVRVTIVHLRVTIGHPTTGHLSLRVTISHIRVTISYFRSS